MKEARALPIDIDELRHAFETGTADLAWYLDSATGEIHSLSRLTGNDESLEALISREPGRFEIIPPGDRSDLYADMARFAVSVGDADLAARLHLALAASNPNRRFKDLLADEEERWVAFRAQQMRGRALDWLRDIGIEAI